MAIDGFLRDGEWVDAPARVKLECLQHFQDRFSTPNPRPIITQNFLKILTSDEVRNLECEVSSEEIKQVVWDYGMDKSPGPDGFIFEFIRKF